MSPTENTTNISRRGELLDSVMLPAQSEVRVQRYLPFEVRVRLYTRVLELAKLSMSYQQIQTEIFDSTHIWRSKGPISGWVRGIHHQSGERKAFCEVASPDFAFVMGWSAGVGILTVTDTY